jgi:hypothetical protein
MDSPTAEPRLLPKDGGSLRLQSTLQGQGGGGGGGDQMRQAGRGGDRGETQNATADPGEPRQRSPDPHHYPLNPAEARTCINYLVDREGTYPFLSPHPSPPLRVPILCVERPIASYITFALYSPS